ncbi:lysophosphatidic acid receptor 4 [Gouania willdenowi]|uniref:Lysophosphatidic acid receptor 4-like n=1 Tax=Gouania willdenowi TaxID=441366 RepID=A0A8C5I3U6_GOUWI|nr:lysophosphatidic acid receptor 4-like [Gouania willdenowi]
MDLQITNCSTNHTKCTVDVLQGVAYSFVFLLGFLVNAAALHAFLSKRNMWTNTHIYMLNLVVADTALIVFLPFRIYDAFFCLPKTLLCSVLISMHFINMYASIWTTAVISVHRFLLIRFPIQARAWRRKKTTAVVVSLVCWGLLVALCVIYHDENHPDKLWTCYERVEDKPLTKHFVAILIVLGFLVPLLILVLCFSQIVRILRKAPNRDEMKRVISIITANMVVFVLCFTPVHVGFLVNHFNEYLPNWKCAHPPAHVNFLVSEWIASTNCCFDSISYYFLLKSSYK